MKRRIASTFLILASAALLTAAEERLIPPFAASAEALLKAAAQIHSDADTVVLSDEKSWSYDAQGRSTYTFHRVYYVNTAAGVRDWSTAESRWEPWHEARPSLRARVVTSEGTVHELDPKTIAEAPVGDQDETFSDARILRAALPALARGSVVEELITVAETSAWFAAGTSHRAYFGYLVPAQSTSVSIEAPANVKLQYSARLLPDVETKRTEENGRIRVVFKQGPMKAMEEAEAHLPFDVPRWPHVTFSTGTSWESVAAAYNRIAEDQLRGANVKSLVAKTEGGSPVEIGRALLARLHKEVRYTGIEFAEASIVPRPPAETLRRKYGDCKDQAALLVAMLRAAGVPAELALLDSGTGYDIDPEMPGLGLFDHAIVHVPGPPELWADPTDEFARFNELPLSDQNRFALLVNEKGALVKTPEVKAAANGFIEKREFFLSERGKARVVETTEPWGAVEVNYRDYYHAPDPKKLKESLQSYAKSTYLSAAPPKYEYSDVQDLSKRFQLRLEMTEAARGTSGDTDAVVAIPVSKITERLPEALRAEDDDKPATPRKGAFTLPEPYAGEWQYRIVPSIGFRSASLPDSGTVHMGPATLSKEFKTEPDGIVVATIRFDTGKRTYSAGEVEELRTAVRSLNKSPMLLVRFEQVGETFLAGGKVREAIGEFRKLAAAHPKEALHHTQIARAMLVAGAAESAREEARIATELDPKSASAYTTLGWVLQHDLVGRRFRKGCDLSGSEKAYRKAVELDQSNYDNRVNLAILLEFAPSGTRYADKENLDRAIDEYRGMEGKLGNGFENNILYALLWSHRFDELRELASKRPRNATVDSLFLAAVAAKGGMEEAVAQAGKRIPDEKDRTAALLSAGQSLFKLRFYKEAADLIETASAGGPQAATMRASTAAIRKARRYEDFMKPATTPTAAFLRFFLVTFLSDVSSETVQSVFVDGSPLAKADTIRGLKAGVAPIRMQLAKAGLSPDVAVDLVLGGTQVKVDGDEDGYRVRAEMASPGGTDKVTAFVVPAAGEYRILSMNDAGPLGAMALKYLDMGKLEIARRWLDWAREIEQLKGGDDPLAGAAFPRFWTRGSEAPTGTIRYAAASLMAHSEDAEKAIPILDEGRAKATSPADTLKFDVALAEAYTQAKNYDRLLPVARDLLGAHPDSESAFLSVVLALSGLKKWEDAMKAIEERLARNPEDHAALSSQGSIAMVRGDAEKCIEIGRKIIAAGSSNPEDWNRIAWASLMANDVTAESIEFAQKGVFASKGAAFGILHTLAALYAEMGKTTEAREVILQAMEVGGQEEPEGNSWYVFGRIDEDYGIADAALAAYKRVDKPATDEALPATTWALAQRRLAVLQKGH
ncbi:MAG TPA: DUF3857 domain-containing protein [Bryobacteraceae bacterium]|nr:DUF3857 domain-containing protein [Bryobacteraceae bacterium]